MKINGITTSATAPPGRPAAAPSTTKAVEAAPAEVRLSGASAELGSEPALDSARLQEIRQAISEGRFAINPSAIADRLIESARELVASQRRG